jgi:hypothetical protein
MSLWKNTTDNPLSAPSWYARHCYFDGTKVADGTISLKDANTQFEVGDAVLYVAPTDGEALGGLTTDTVYYVKGVTDSNYSLASSREGDAITVTATAEATTQMFIKCDTYETTEDGTLNYAIIPVTIEEAKSAKYGKAINSQGWWRYRRFTKAGDTEATIHAERLVGFKGDFDVTTLTDDTTETTPKEETKKDVSETDAEASRGDGTIA